MEQIDNAALDFVFIDGGTTPVAPDNDTGLRRLPFHVLVCSDGMTSLVSRGSHTLTLDDGESCLIRKNETHRIVTCGGRHPVSVWCHFRLTLLHSTDLLDFFELPDKFSCGESRRISEACRILVAGKREESFRQMLFRKSAGLRLVEAVTQACPERAGTARHMEHLQRLAPAIDFMNCNLSGAILCSTTSGGADHNNSAVEASFYGVTYSEGVPDEFRTHIADMQTAFSFLDSAVAEANATMTDGNRLDPIQVKAIFYALCFGENAPSQRAADRFVDCFFITEQRTRIVVTELEDGSTVETEEVYTATVPLSLAAAYENLAAKLGRTITDEDKENAAHIYTMIAGNANGSDGTGASGGTIQIDYGYGGSTELDTSQFTNPAGKNADDLVQYAIHAYEEHWGYVWGTFGLVLTEGLFESKLAQYPDALAGNAEFIRQTWVGGRTTDCVGLIKGYGWLDAETEEIVYNTNGMPDITANEMYHAATVSGTIDTIPETPGLAVWHDGHIGVYIGNGEVVEAMGTCYGVVKTKIEGARWTHWLKIPYISYD